MGLVALGFEAVDLELPGIAGLALIDLDYAPSDGLVVFSV